MNNTVVMIQLDRERELRFAHRAMKRWCAFTGKTLNQIDIQSMGPGEIEDIMFFMLEKDAETHGETLTMSMMEDLLDMTDLGTVYNKLGEALMAAFPDQDSKEKNGNRAAAGTGKSG